VILTHKYVFCQHEINLKKNNLPWHYPDSGTSTYFRLVLNRFSTGFQQSDGFFEPLQDHDVKPLFICFKHIYKHNICRFL